MATILTKKKDTTGAPSAGDLTNSTGGAELAVNTADKRLYTKDSGGNVVEVGINPTSITTGTLNTSGAVVFNESGADVDFRVEGDTEANLLFVDASANAVGVGTDAPKVQAWRTGSTLTVQGTVAGNYEVSSSRTDADSVAVGSYQFALTTADASHKTIAVIEGQTSGATAGQRGGDIRFLTKANGTAAPAERMLLTSDGYLRMASGSGGIQFGGDTSAGNALDDYEEGSWTPVWNNVTLGNGTSIGTYVKIGRLVYADARLTWGSTTSASGTISVSIPFAGLSGVTAGSAWLLDSGTTSYIVAAMRDSASYTTVQIGDGTGAGFISNTSPFTFTTNDKISVGFTYQAA